MDKSHSLHTRPEISPPRRPQFSINGLLALMFILSMVAAGAFYFVQAVRVGRNWKLVFIMFTLIAPVLVGIVASVVRQFVYPKLLSLTADRNSSGPGEF